MKRTYTIQTIRKQKVLTEVTVKDGYDPKDECNWLDREDIHVIDDWLYDVLEDTLEDE